MDYLERVQEIYTAPSAGAAYSLPLRGSEQPGRSPIYRHWRFQKQLLDTLDPHVAPLIPQNRDKGDSDEIFRFSQAMNTLKQPVKLAQQNPRCKPTY